MDDEGDEKTRVRVRSIALGVVIGVIAAAAALFIYSNLSTTRVLPAQLKYQDLISTVLTALAVILAVLGVIAGLLGFWGYANFKRLARRAARSYIRDDIKSGRIKKHIEVLVLDFLRHESQPGGRFDQILKDEALRISISGADLPASRARTLPRTQTNEDEDEGDV